MTDSAGRISELDKKYVWHPFTQMKDWLDENHPVIVKGEGNWLIDVDGRRYLDGVASIWTNVHGHCNPFINEALKRQIDLLEHSTQLGLINDKAALLAEKLVNIAPSPLAKVFYSDNGSTAVEVGVKMAFQYWIHKGNPAKNRFISFRNAYHGDTLGAVSVGGIDLFHEVFRPLLFQTIQAPSPYCYRCELTEDRNPESCGRLCLKKLEELAAANRETVAALIIEPLVQGAGGMIVQPKGFLKRVREICNENNILMIADEVAVGFGRTGKMFACEQEGVTPDIMALSKGITAGYLPLAATLTTEEVFNAFLGDYSELKTFFHGHTFTGNPIACSAALASLELFEKERLLEKLPCKVNKLESRLKKSAELSHVGDTRQYGMIAAIELVKDKLTREAYDWKEKTGIRTCCAAMGKGLFLRPLGNNLVIFPPLSITDDEIDFMMDVIDEAISETTG